MTDGTASPATAPLPSFITSRDIFAGGATPTPSAVVHVFPTGPQIETLELYDFNFLGKRFKPETYVERPPGGASAIPHSGAGVCKPMARRLIAAQEEIFRLFVAHRKLEKGPTAPDPTETEFNTFCGLQGNTGGWSFREGKHSFGAAVDIDSNLNPYVATRTGTIFGGELGRFGRRNVPAAKVALLQEHVFKPAVEAYDRAVFMLLGEQGGVKATADVAHFQKGADPSETFRQAHARFHIVHRALKLYFGLAFDPVPASQQAALAVSDLHNKGIFIDVFEERFRKLLESGSGATSFRATHPEFASDFDNDRNGFLARLRERIARDHIAVRKVMVTGSLVVEAPEEAQQFRDATANTSRDPCHGFMSLRREIVQGMSEQTSAGLRWGACQFSERANGDIMHFDMGQGFRPGAADGLRQVTVPAGTTFTKS